MLPNLGVFITLLILVTTITVRCYETTMISPVAKAGCQSRCGNISVMYPFGIGSSNCFYNEWFEIQCHDDRPHLIKYSGPGHVGAEVLQINPSNEYYGGGVRAISINTNTLNMHVCEDTSERLAGNLTGSPFKYRWNKLMVIGCGNGMFFNGKDVRKGCTSACDSGNTTTPIKDCYGINCCQETVPYICRPEYYLSFSNSIMGKNSCASVFLVDENWYPENISLFLDPSADLDGVTIPIRLSWDILTTTPGPGFGNNKNCQVYGMYWSCFCPCGVYGNPYLPDGCQDRIENQKEYCSRTFVKKNLTSIVGKLVSKFKMSSS